MNKIRISLILVFIFLLFSLTPKIILAEDTGQFVTIVNPVRISYYNKTPGESLRNQYSIIKKNNFPATWLLTYDAIQNLSIGFELKKMDKNQEFGLFLEVTPALAKDSGVVYHNTGSWHYATSVFLSGYTQDERKVLIDKIFRTFKEKFGYYPKSIGSWWTDAYSLSYMKVKYGIVASLVCSDQYSTDGYQIWGQPWQIPYYPSKLFSAVPAQDKADKIDIVNIQWAARDPLNGYESSLYSTQDYTVAKQPQKTDFFKKMAELYLSYGQITVGLESDLDPWAYAYGFTNQMDAVRGLRQKGILIVTMSDYANWYRQKYPGVSPSYKIESNDLLGKNAQSFWYGSNKYRLFYVKDIDKNEINIMDLRIYNSSLKDPYYDSPNFQFTLSENIPSVIDAASDPNNIWILPGDFEIVTNDDNFFIKGKRINIPSFIKKSPLIDVTQTGNGVRVSMMGDLVPTSGIQIKDFSVEALHFFRQKLAILYLLMGRGRNYLTKVDYTIPQGEVYALLYLKSQPPGRVMVYDGECLQCSWHTKFKPPEFSNQRGYVGKYSGNSIVYNKSVFIAKTQAEAKKEFDKLHVKYVYLVKLEGYIEKLPFSPGDLNVEKIFSNANVEIWRVK